MLQKKITQISFGIAATITAIMWVVFFFDYTFELNWYKYGLYPQNKEGLLGIITAPFLHSTKGFSHIINNSVPTFVLSWMLFYHYRTVATRSFIFIYLFTGISMWFLARESYHIGMSGVIYGLTSFLIVSGFLRKNMKVAGISLVVIFLYGSTVWGIFPNQVGVSWEAHAFGFLSGGIIAFYFRKSGPQPAKLRYEIEEELGIEPEVEYWKTPEQQPPQHEPKIIINYTIVPKKVEVEKEKKENDV
jgi:membrane associated rhomboid family serine protease